MKLSIGGVQNYIRCLADVMRGNGIEPIVYQYASNRFEYMYNGIKTIGVESAKSSKNLLTFIYGGDYDLDNDLLIFSTDFMICKNHFRHSIAIQHGIAWDITQDGHVSDLINYLAMIKNTLRAFVKYRRYKNCGNLVCVDYNFLNWYRTQVAHIDTKCYVIPNFASIIPAIPRERSDYVSVVFARRLVDYRGTKLFVKAIVPLLNKYNIRVTIAGVGPDEHWMKENLKSFENVYFTSYSAQNSLSFHSQFDIAIIPTKGSEGTSLSLLEAMSAGCAPIATNVGGMTNIILDGYNGRLISPNVEELRAAIEELIEDPEKRASMAVHARETVQTSFSYDKWAQKWIKTIRMIDNT